MAVTLLLLSLVSGNPFRAIGFNRLIAAQPVPFAHEATPIALAWDPSGQHLAMFPYRGGPHGTMLHIWPKNRELVLPLTQGGYYVHWSPNGKQLLVGDTEQAVLVDVARLRIRRLISKVTCAIWDNGKPVYRHGLWPNIDDLPDVADGHPRPLGTDTTLVSTTGKTGSLHAVITKSGFALNYVPVRGVAKTLTFAEEIPECRPFCTLSGQEVLIGLPDRSIDGSATWTYRNGQAKPYDFSSWTRKGPGRSDPLGEVFITASPVITDGRCIAAALRMGEKVVNAHHASHLLLDFTNRTMVGTSDSVVGLAGSSSKKRLAAIVALPEDRGMLYVLSAR